MKIFFILSFTLNLFSYTLSSTYYIDSKNIKLQHLIPHAKYNITLYKIDKNNHTKKIKAQTILTLLKQHGFKNIKTSGRYIKFIEKSPIYLDSMKSSIKKYYKEKYLNIIISSLTIIPRRYIQNLPHSYELKLQKNAYLKKSGIFSIKTLNNKRIYFDFFLDAMVEVYETRTPIKKGERISLLNTKRKYIKLDKFRALPINTTHLNKTQVKRNTKINSILNLRDIETLNLVKKGAHVSVRLNNNNISISFSAKALQNGKLRDIITIQKNDKKRLKVKVVGHNQVEIQ
ncbi:flagellar basal body P-ring formation protein FlgA [Sulfurimonas sp. SAG-AH-194-I05]|nr:flagellar basal body P-ring formation chaperone FlgA [Sulfurimonas sp. SAG-AH-194-I05]MDF1875466.1 flagellar basal body P-ring formation protein FlgA [Sulfurimonas sp. SAG-AH-194-I05]